MSHSTDWFPGNMSQDQYFNRRVRHWMHRLEAMLEIMCLQNTELAGHTETVVPEIELWAKLGEINKAIKSAQEKMAKQLTQEYDVKAAFEKRNQSRRRRNSANRKLRLNSD